MGKNNRDAQTLPMDCWETEIMAVQLLKAYLFSMPKAEQKRILEGFMNASAQNPNSYTVDIDRLIDLLQEIIAAAATVMDTWLADSTLSASFRHNIRKSKDAILGKNLALLRNSRNPYLTRVLVDLYKNVG